MRERGRSETYFLGFRSSAFLSALGWAFALFFGLPPLPAFFAVASLAFFFAALRAAFSASALR